jgi:CRP/FNR family transcriptional regulator, polysaccharide utilization system transcription regulator
MRPGLVTDTCNCLDCIRKSPIFRFLSDEQLIRFNENRYETKYNAGEIIFKQGTAMTHMMSFTSGLAKIYLEGSNQRNIILRIIKAGEFIGGPGMFTDFRHHFTVRAIEDSSACFIDVNVFKDIMNENTEFSIQTYKSANMHTLKNFQKFVSLTQKQMPGRIADAIIYLYEEIYQSNPFQITLSRQELGDMTALSKESAIRILKQFKDEKIISINQNELEILNEDALYEISRIG